MQNRITVLAVVGPTASGKTALGVELAKKLNGEVVSADSMQIYQGMEIATAKPSIEEMQGIPHHLLGVIPPTQPFSVADYVEMAGQSIEEIKRRGKLPILVGGTGLYINSLLDHIRFPEIKTSPALREELIRQAQTPDGMDRLFRELREIDPGMARSLNVNNKKRVIRAIEVYRSTGVTMTEQIRRSRLEPSPYAPLMIGLNFRNRETLYQRINLRVDRMVAQGLLEEAKKFYQMPETGTSAQAIGYKELLPYLKGALPLEAALENLKRETRRYAKRQITWFKRDERIQWLYLDDENSSVDLYLKEG